MLNSPVFGIFLSVICFYFGTLVNKRFKSSLLNPLLVAIIIIIIILKAFNISYDDFMVGGAFIQFMIMPTTVALAVPFYRNFDVFLKYKWPILIGSAVGSITALTSILIMGKYFGLDRNVLISILPKSITTAIALPLTKEFGGIPSITSFAISITGLLGVIVCDFLLKRLKIDIDIAKGAALGTASHAIGTSKALTISEIAGAISGLCIVIAGFITVLLFPIFIKFV